MLLHLIFIFSLNLAGQENTADNAYNIKAEIIGYDYSKCRCCGGWKVKIDNKIYLTVKMPAKELQLSSNNSIGFPVPVLLSYQTSKSEGPCKNKLEITCIKRL